MVTPICDGDIPFLAIVTMRECPHRKSVSPPRDGAYNYQVGENYYLPMTSYIESKTEKANSSLPGPLCFSERIAAHPIVGQQKSRSSTSFEMTTSSSAGL